DAEDASVLAAAHPHDEEIPARVRGDGRVVLVAGGIGVDPELAALRDPRGVEALAEDAEAASVLSDAVPDDDEIAARVRGHGRPVLEVRGVGVDPEVAALRNGEG